MKDTEEDRLRRREQTLFDRRAVEQGGFMVMSMSSTRWFSRASVSLSSPERTVLRYDVRAAQSFDDASHADIARDVKLALVYAAIASRIPEPDSGRLSLSLAVVDEAMRDLLARLLALVSVRYLGVHPLTLEPVFATDRGEIMSFDRLPTSIRHLVAFAVFARARPCRCLSRTRPAHDRRSRVDRRGCAAPRSLCPAGHRCRVARRSSSRPMDSHDIVARSGLGVRALRSDRVASHAIVEAC